MKLKKAINLITEAKSDKRSKAEQAVEKRNKQIKEFLRKLKEEATAVDEDGSKRWEGAKIYYHIDMDGVGSAIAMREILKKYGMPTVDVETIQYGEPEFAVDMPEHSKIFPVLVDFAHGKPFIQIHTDHHDSKIGHEFTKNKFFIHARSNARALTRVANRLGSPVFNSGMDKIMLDAIDSADFRRRKLSIDDVIFAIRKFKESISKGGDPSKYTKQEINRAKKLMALAVNATILANKNKKGVLKKIVTHKTAMSFKSLFKLLSDPEFYKEFDRFVEMDVVDRAKEEYIEALKSKTSAVETDSKSDFKRAVYNGVKSLKIGHAVQVDNIVFQYGMPNFNDVKAILKGGYDRYAVFKNHPSAEYVVLGWPMGLVQISKNPDIPMRNPKNLGELMKQVTREKFQKVWSNQPISIFRLKKYNESGAFKTSIKGRSKDEKGPIGLSKHNEPIRDRNKNDKLEITTTVTKPRAAGFTMNDFLATYGDLLSDSEKEQIRPYMDTLAVNLDREGLKVLKNISIPLWDVILRNSGGHKDITNLTNLKFLTYLYKNGALKDITARESNLSAAKQIMIAVGKRMHGLKLIARPDAEEEASPVSIKESFALEELLYLETMENL